MLAAGSGQRLRPLTSEKPKAMCPVAGVPLVDLALGHLGLVGLYGPGQVAVNAHHLAGQLEEHLIDRVHLSVEAELLGTGGGVGQLREWIAGRAVLVVNADAVHDARLESLVDGWDGERIRFLTAAAAAPASLGPTMRLCGVLMPWTAVLDLEAERSSIAEQVWRPWEAAGGVELLAADVGFVDCGTPAAYLAANLWRSGGASVVGRGTVVDGEVDRCVLWSGSHVRAGERLVDAVRTASGMTVLVRRL